MNQDSNKWNSAEEREISITAVFWKILHGWRLVLTSGIVLAVLLTAAKYMKDVKTMEADNKSASSYTIEQLSSEDQLEIASAEALQKQLDQKEDYMESSVLMKLDPYQKNVVTLQYYVDTGYNFNLDSEVPRDNTVSLINSYIAYVSDSGLLQKVCKSLNWDIEDAYVAELIDTSAKVTGANDAMNQSAVFSVYLTGTDEEAANQLADAVETAIGEYQSVLEEKIGSHQLKLVDRYVGKQSDTGLSDKQNTLETSIANIRTQLNTLTAGFSVEQQQLLSKDSGANEETAKTTITQLSINKKYLLLGMGVGVFLACVWIALFFILDNRLKTVQELQRFYSLRVFGNLERDSKKKRLFSGVDKWLDSLQYKDKPNLEHQKSMTLMNLKVTCKQQGIQHLFFTNVVNLSNKEQKSLDELIESIRLLGIKVDVGKDILHNADSFEKMVEIGNVIVIEKIEETYHNNFQQELRFCEEQKAQVLGAIVFA